MRWLLLAAAVRVGVDARGALAEDPADARVAVRLSASELTAELADAAGLWDGKYTTADTGSEPLTTAQVQSVLDWVGQEMDQVRGFVLDSLEKTSFLAREPETEPEPEQDSPATTWVVPEYMGAKLNADVKLLTTMLEESSRTFAVDSRDASTEAELEEVEDPPTPVALAPMTDAPLVPDAPPGTTRDSFHPEVAEKIDPILAWGKNDEVAWIDAVATNILHPEGPLSQDWTALWQAVAQAPEHDDLAAKGPAEADSKAKFDLRLRLADLLRKVAANKMVDSEAQPGTADVAREEEAEELAESRSPAAAAEALHEELEANRDELEEELETGEKSPMEKDADLIDGIREEGAPPAETMANIIIHGGKEKHDNAMQGIKESEERAQNPNEEGDGPPTDETEDEAGA